MATIAEKLILPNFLSKNILEELELSSNADIGATVLNVINANNAAHDNYLVINPGKETGELRQIDTVLAQAITITGAVSVNHKQRERIIRLFGNRIRIWRAPNVTGYAPDDTDFVLNGSGVIIDPDQPYSSYTDPAGGSGFWYKATYYNDADGSETPLANSEAVRGGGYEHYVSLDDLTYESGLNNTKSIESSQVAQRRLEAEGEVKGALAAAGYAIPLQTAAGVVFKPDLIVGVTRLLGAGLILSQNFGTAKPSSAKDGKSKQDAARVTIKAIQDNKILLLDSTGAILKKPSLVDGLPTDATATIGTDGVHGEPAKATMSKVF